MSREYICHVQGIEKDVAKLSGIGKDMDDPISVFIDKEGNIYVMHSENLSAAIKIIPRHDGITILSHSGYLDTVKKLDVFDTRMDHKL